MEFIIGFIAGWALSWPAFIAVLLLGVWCEANDSHGWSVFMGICAMVVAFFFFSIPLEMLLIGVGVYFIVGFVWSFWRYKRHCDKVIGRIKSTVSETDKRYLIQQLMPAAMLSSITTWVIVWPFSVIENISGDLITLVQDIISKFFKGMYSRIYTNAIGKLNDQC